MLYLILNAENSYDWLLVVCTLHDIYEFDFCIIWFLLSFDCVNELKCFFHLFFVVTFLTKNNLQLFAQNQTTFTSSYKSATHKNTQGE